MAQAEGVTEVLKSSDQMAWVGAMNNIRNRAEAVALEDIVYSLDYNRERCKPLSVVF